MVLGCQGAPCSCAYRRHSVQSREFARFTKKAAIGRQTLGCKVAELEAARAEFLAPASPA